MELEALRARLAETERAMQRIVSQLAQRDAVLKADWWTGFRTILTVINIIVIVKDQIIRSVICQ